MTFWQSNGGRILRWLLFLPIGLLVGAVLESIPILAFRFAATVELRFTLLTLIIGLVFAPFLTSLVALWFYGVFLTPMLACGIIAPTPKIASVIFGTLFLSFQVLTLFSWLFDGQTGWALIIFKALFSLWLMGGIIAAHGKNRE